MTEVEFYIALCRLEKMAKDITGMVDWDELARQREESRD